MMVRIVAERETGENAWTSWGRQAAVSGRLAMQIWWREPNIRSCWATIYERSRRNIRAYPNRYTAIECLGLRPGIQRTLSGLRHSSGFLEFAVEMFAKFIRVERKKRSAAFKMHYEDISDGHCHCVCDSRSKNKA